MQFVRHSVKENTLSDPNLVPDEDVAYYITEKGKGWICEIDNQLIGFAIIDLLEKSVWALFENPEFAEKGIGKELHRRMVVWYFEQTRDKLTLGTDANTRTKMFYALQGWTHIGSYPNGETKFELSYQNWRDRNSM